MSGASRILAGGHARAGTPGKPCVRKPCARKRDRASAMVYPRAKAVTAREPKDEETAMTEIDTATQTELEAAVFRRLVAHLQTRSDVQNIDLMNMAGFCRNCLSNWMKDAADERGLGLTKDETRERVYGMPYEQWKRLNQAEATPEQQSAFSKAQAEPH